MRALLALVGISLQLACSEPYAGRGGSGGLPPAPASTRAPDPAAEPPAAEPPAPVVDDPKAGDVHYVELVLGGAAADATLPMVVAIHGLGDDPRNFGHLFESFSSPVRLILPRGLDPREAGGYSWFPLRARDPDVAGLSQGIAQAADQLAVAIDTLARTRPTAGKPIVTGFSQGGMLSFAIAVRHPESISLALPIGGWLPPPLWPTVAAGAKAPHIVAFHGTDDGAVKFEPTERAVDELRKHGWPVELHAYPGVGHVITPEIHRDLDDALDDGVRAIAKTKPRP